MEEQRSKHWLASSTPPADDPSDPVLLWQCGSVEALRLSDVLGSRDERVDKA